MPEEVIKRVEQLGKLDGQPNILTFTNEDGEKFLDEGDEEYEEDISYGSETENQDVFHDNVEEITGVESEDSDNEDDITYSDDGENPRAVPDESDELYVQPDNANRLRRPGRLSPTSVISNIEPAVAADYPNPDMTPAEAPRRYPSRNRRTVQRLDPSYSTRESYDNAMIQYMCMS